MECRFCGKVMGHKEDNGCNVTHFKFIPSSEFLKEQPDSEDLIRSRTVIAPRVRVGAENDMYTSEQYKEMNMERCPDCGAPVGSYHHAGCDSERCPRCGSQWITCDCCEEYDVVKVYATSDAKPKTLFERI